MLSSICLTRRPWFFVFLQKIYASQRAFQLIGLEEMKTVLLFLFLLIFPHFCWSCVPDDGKECQIGWHTSHWQDQHKSRGWHGDTRWCRRRVVFLSYFLLFFLFVSVAFTRSGTRVSTCDRFLWYSDTLLFRLSLVLRRVWDEQLSKKNKNQAISPTRICFLQLAAGVDCTAEISARKQVVVVVVFFLDEISHSARWAPSRLTARQTHLQFI